MHIVQIIPTLRHGGAERLVVSLSNGLVAQGYTVSIVTFFDDIPLKALLHTAIDVHVVEKKSALPFGLISRLRATLAQLHPDIIHTHLFGADIWGQLAAKHIGCPIVSTEHNTNVSEGVIKHMLKRLLKREGTTYVAVSQVVASYMKKHYGIPRAEIIYPGVDTHLFSACELSSFALPLRFLMIGRLVKQKGFDIGVKALAKVRDLDWTLSIVGSGEDDVHLRALVQEVGIEDRTHFFGTTDRVMDTYNAADIVMIPSRWEGFGMVAVEAMSAGRIVVAAAVGGLKESLRDKKNGFLFPAEHVDALSSVIRALFDDTNTLQGIAAQATQDAYKYDIAKMIDAYTDLYTRLV